MKWYRVWVLYQNGADPYEMSAEACLFRWGQRVWDLILKQKGIWARLYYVEEIIR